ncbi:MAG: HAD-IA family hydrolase [bacterium]|nr:HAD-IA family hydrolase [bacterium]
MKVANVEPKLVIFDCDGTLVDSQHIIIKAMRTAFETLGLTPPSDRDIRGIIGLSLTVAVDALVPEVQKEKLPQLCDIFKASFIAQRELPYFHEPLFLGAREILQELSDREDILLGVATGKSRRGVDKLFERENLGQYFYNIQTADDAPSKPHPGMILRAIEQTGINSRNVLMIGDTTFDIEMARNADVEAIGVRWGYHEESALVDAGAHSLIDQFSEITDLLATFDQAACQ